MRWDAGAKGRKARRVPITRRGTPFLASGLDTLIDRLADRVGFRVHCHAFRHTFATVQAKSGRSLEHLRAAMGHEDYGMLIRYVKLASTLDLGPLSAWEEFVALPHPGQYR